MGMNLELLRLLIVIMHDIPRLMKTVARPA